MTLQNIIAEARRLSLEEQIELWSVLGEMIGPPPDVPLTAAQEKDLDARIDEYRAGEAEMIPGDQAMARLRARL
jgi:putative addiction module component (TIGR02574 family)